MTDLFRIGLLVILLFTTIRTAAQTGYVLPLMAGAIFVAILIPTAMSDEDSNKFSLILVGLASNAVILGVILALRMVAARLTGTRPER